MMDFQSVLLWLENRSASYTACILLYYIVYCIALYVTFSVFLGLDE